MPIAQACAPRFDGRLAQLGERCLRKAEVGSSNLLPSIDSLGQSSRGRLAQLEERCLHTAEVTGSSPVSPTRDIKELEAF